MPRSLAQLQIAAENGHFEFRESRQIWKINEKPMEINENVTISSVSVILHVLPKTDIEIALQNHVK